MAVTQLEELILSLEEINFTPDGQAAGKYENLDGFINVLKTMDKDLNPNMVGSCVLTIISHVPDIMDDPNNNRLEKLCRELKTKEVYLSNLVLMKFFGNQPELHSAEEPAHRAKIHK